MLQKDVPYYTDPDDFLELGEAAKYPCSSNFMTYNPLLHRYFLTLEGLMHYGINVERKYRSDNPNKVQELIERTSKKVYDYINYKAGFRCYQVMMYRIATAPKTIYPDQYFMRKQFEEALADQARFIVENGDAIKYSHFNLDSEMQQPPLKPEDALRDISDMSPECIRTLETLNLTRWFNLAPNQRLDNTKY